MTEMNEEMEVEGERKYGIDGGILFGMLEDFRSLF